MLRHLHSRKASSWLGLLGVIILSSLIVSRLFWSVLTDPDAYFFSTGGDALHTYFGVAFYVKYNTGHYLSAMNYPFGEHVNYPDMQPLVSGILSFVNHHVVAISDHTIGIMNILILLSITLTPIVLYAILRRLLLPDWYAILSALLIGFLAPQHIRIDAHITLSYACFVPILWYLIVRMLEAPQQTRWYAWYGIACVLMGMVTPYYVAMGSFFLLAHALILLGQEVGSTRVARGRLWRQVGRLIFTALLPLLVFRGWLWLTDPALDRPDNPYGFYVYIASFASIFAPVLPPLHEMWRTLFGTAEPEWEGWAYVGVVPVLVLAATLVLALRYVVRGRWRLILRPSLPSPLRIGLWSTTLLLLLAMAYPFSLPGFGWIPELIKPLKQFRSLGRFAWPFYYVFTAYASFYLYRLWRYLRQHRAGTFALTLLLPLLLLWSWEARSYIVTKAEQVQQQPVARSYVEQKGNYTALLSWANRKPTDYQAILLLPYYILGTDVLFAPGSAQSIYQGYKASLNTGLPLLSIIAARAEVSRTMRLVQLFSSPLLPKPLLTEFPNRKPILLVVAHDQPLTDQEQRLVDLSQQVTANQDATLYELPLSALAATTTALELAKAQLLLPTLTPVHGLYTTTGTGAVVESFDKRLTSQKGHLQPGAFYEPAEVFSRLYQGPVPTPADTGAYEVSAWVNARMGYGLGVMQIKQYDANGTTLETRNADPRTATDIDGDWVRIVLPFRLQAGATRLEVLYLSRELLIDDLMIRPLDTDVYYYVGPDTNRRLVKNTYLLTP